MDINYSSIGLRIKYFRSERKITQEELAELVGTTSRHIINIEMGIKGPSLNLLVSIANALEVTSDDLLIDNLSHYGSISGYEVSDLILDCNSTEKAILTKAMKRLKELLLEYGI
ncbi:helix-turn-helix domain-containing protein [Ruminococcus flavefaciens]|uniref:helix-turn-helix domain-containing protein n=1 Tax=Ruminococcus flavefaciens TaxID=1265 RepID=UPI0026E9F21A|nr:helix-turn-helix transcriptional regulator [Ruminococcus flavefaciens]